MTERIVYGIKGRKGHGKDTFANMVKENDDEFVIWHFADELKRLAEKIFGLTYEQMHDPELKESKFDKPVEMDNFLEDIYYQTNLDITPKKLRATSPRELLQYFGTDYVRSVDDNYWTNFLRSKILTSDEKKIIVADCRFLDESDMITYYMGGIIIEIIRKDLLKNNTDTHISETGMDTIRPNFIIETITGKFDTLKYGALLASKNCLPYDQMVLTERGF